VYADLAAMFVEEWQRSCPKRPGCRTGTLRLHSRHTNDWPGV